MELRNVAHTFLFQEGTWAGQGVFIAQDGQQIQVQGQSCITHQPGLWINQGWMRLDQDEPSEFSNRYEITPFAPGRLTTQWTSYNPALGQMQGRFVVVDDCILSLFRSQDWQHQGHEVLLLLEPATYLNRGVLFCQDTRVSSWALTLVRLA